MAALLHQPLRSKSQPLLPSLQVFDILPLYGALQPGESQRVTFTFFGHANIVARVMALCKVEGGPTYEIMLSGEASLINYLLDVTEIDCGLQVLLLLAEVLVLKPSPVGCLPPRSRARSPSQLLWLHGSEEQPLSLRSNEMPAFNALD